MKQRVKQQSLPRTISGSSQKMKTIAGLWIDHRKAVITIVSTAGEETMVIRSNVEKQPGRFFGARSTVSYESHSAPADDSHEREFTNHLHQYYLMVIGAVRVADSILIFGPGEAKGEFTKYLERARLGRRISEIETTDKMTDRQVASKAREYFDKYNHLSSKRC